ncbi:MAG: hypothetical protein U1E76_06515 [Planctomycetota bacterium]
MRHRLAAQGCHAVAGAVHVRRLVLLAAHRVLRFRAVGADLNPGLLAAGYTAGVIASTVSFIPGGLGIFEAAGILVYTMHGNMTADSVIAPAC